MALRGGRMGFVSRDSGIRCRRNGHQVWSLEFSTEDLVQLFLHRDPVHGRGDLEGLPDFQVDPHGGQDLAGPKSTLGGFQWGLRS